MSFFSFCYFACELLFYFTEMFKVSVKCNDDNYGNIVIARAQDLTVLKIKLKKKFPYYSLFIFLIMQLNIKCILEF